MMMLLATLHLPSQKSNIITSPSSTHAWEAGSGRKCGDLVSAYTVQAWDECDTLVAAYDSDTIIKGIVEKSMC